ncbi:hypothetical protein JOD31_001055 [Methylopila capsulata]|uniref:Uncharacterized protein n=1 Tax=Methylopila capsulata TaxID=61654 RepID=A0A9W6ITW2_9HYPH|nr:hypothetical protein [Methylopila capsulata]MBM7850843.1 hypothetical protein [Methylopila capsulata]GLK56138.1 hypothetical protein GCM10008170_21570 [Methylopila capsulata]
MTGNKGVSRSDLLAMGLESHEIREVGGQVLISASGVRKLAARRFGGAANPAEIDNVIARTDGEFREALERYKSESGPRWAH